MDAQQSSPRFPPWLVLAFGIFGISSGSILARLAQNEAVPSLVIAAWRLGLATAVLLPLTLSQSRKRQELRALRSGDWQLALLSGFMLALHFASWISSLAYTSVASSTVLATTSPLWVALAAPLLLRERLTRPLQIGITLALLGSFLIGVGDLLAWQNGRFLFSLTAFSNQPNPLLGNILALLGAFAAALYLILGRRLRPHVSLLSYITIVYGTAAGFLFLFALLAGQNLFGYGSTAFLLFIAMALLPQLSRHSAYNWALGYMPAAYVSIAVIAEPIGATLLALLLFGEVPTLATLLGSALLLGGIIYASRYNGR